MIISAYTARTVRLALGCLVLTSTSALMATELQFIWLNACNDLSSVLISLKQPPDRCRTATGIVERTIHDFAAGNDERICFLENPPVASLSDFKCFQASLRGWRTITCLRPASASLVSDYKAMRSCATGFDW